MISSRQDLTEQGLEKRSGVFLQISGFAKNTVFVFCRFRQNKEKRPLP
jgi:hypothetical protein